MLEVNAIYLILLTEGFALLLFLVLIWVLVSVFRIRRKGKAVSSLVLRFKQKAGQRSAQTETFLQAVYHLEGPDLNAALQDIEQQQQDYFQLLVACLKNGKTVHIDGLDAALEQVIESYKCMQPRIEEHGAEAPRDEQEVGMLRHENEELRGELSQARDSLNDMIAEFGNMFGGGKDHELGLHELKKKLAAMQASGDTGTSNRPQK